MTIKIIYKIVEDDSSYEEGPYEKTFEDRNEYFEWLQNQRGHPFLSIKIISKNE